MWALVKSGSVDTIIGGPVALTLNDIQYPKSIFNVWSDSELLAIGIYKIVDKDRPDHNFYDVGPSSYSYNSGTDKVNEDFTVTEKNVDKLKSDLTESTQHQGMDKLMLYDWLTSRYIFDNTKAIPSAVTTYAAAVRSHCATICTAIDDCSDLDAIKVVHAKIYAADGEYNTGWPDDKDVNKYKRNVLMGH